jgi:hypothetical protein
LYRYQQYVVKTLDEGYKWQEGANNLLVLPDPWDIPEGSVFMVDDNFAGLTRSSQNQLAVKLINVEKEIVQLKMETQKAKEMTKASLQVGAVHSCASSSPVACENRSTYRVKPFYVSSETVLPIKPFCL